MSASSLAPAAWIASATDSPRSSVAGSACSPASLASCAPSAATSLASASIVALASSTFVITASGLRRPLGVPVATDENGCQTVNTVAARRASARRGA